MKPNSANKIQVQDCNMIAVDRDQRRGSTQHQLVEIGSDSDREGRVIDYSISQTVEESTRLNLPQLEVPKGEFYTVRATEIFPEQVKDGSAVLGRMQVSTPRRRDQPVLKLISDHRSPNNGNVEETVLELYHAELLKDHTVTGDGQFAGARFSQLEVLNMFRQVTGQIEAWRKRPITTIFPYVFLAGIELECSWGNERRRASVLTAVGVNEYGVREVLGVAEGALDSDAAWGDFLQQLKGQGLFGVLLFVGDRCAGLAKRLAQIFPEADFQNSVVQFCHEVLSQVPTAHLQRIEKMLDRLLVSPDWPTARRLIIEMIVEMKRLKLISASELFEKHIWDSMQYLAFPKEHRGILRANCAQKKLLRGLCEHSRKYGTFFDGISAVHLVSARLRYIESKVWNEKCNARGCFEGR